MPLINCKIKLNMETWKKECVLSTDMVMQYLLLMTQKCKFQLLLSQNKIIKILLKNKIKDFKDLFIGTKQKN